MADDVLIPTEAADGEALELDDTGTVSKHFKKLDAANEYGVVWAWRE